MKQRYVRPSGGLSDETIVVVRGGALDATLLAEDARKAYAVYGVYAVSVFAADGVSIDELVQSTPLVRFGSLTLMTVGAIRAGGFELVPSGRNPLHHSVDLGDLEAGVNRLLRCEHRTIVNPYHES